MSALPHQIAEYEEKHRHSEKSAHAGEREHDDIRDFSAGPARDHVCAELCFVMVKISSRATAFTTIVMQKSTKHSSISAEICMLLVASVNSFAMAAAME